VTKIFHNRIAYVCCDYGPFAYEGFLDDGRALRVTYNHEEISPWIQIQVESDFDEIWAKYYGSKERWIWYKDMSNEPELEMDDLKVLIEIETGLKLIIEPELEIIELTDQSEIQMKFLSDLEHMGLNLAERKRRERRSDERKNQLAKFKFKRFG